MTNKHWQLPDGVDELLPPVAQAVEDLRRRLLNLFASWGYQLVAPPILEFLDALMIKGNHQLALSTFQVTDQISGRMLGLRPDFSSQVARMDAHSLPTSGTQRLCYAGEILLARPSAAGEGRCPIKAGAEIYGYSCIDADIEIVRLLCETLSCADAPPFHIELGHTAIYRTLIAPLGLSQEQDDTLFEALQSKSLADLERLLDTYKAPPKTRDWLMRLPVLLGDEDVLQRARVHFEGADAAIIAALDQLEAILTEMKHRLPNVKVTFDLAELRGYQYHTGALYTAYADDLGLPIAKGGRYDGQGAAFGRPRAATGFDTDLVMLAKLKQRPAEPAEIIFAPCLNACDQQASSLVTKIHALRAQGRAVVVLLPDEAPPPSTPAMKHLVWDQAQEGWHIVSPPEQGRPGD